MLIVLIRTYNIFYEQIGLTAGLVKTKNHFCLNSLWHAVVLFVIFTPISMDVVWSYREPLWGQLMVLSCVFHSLNLPYHSTRLNLSYSFISFMYCRLKTYLINSLSMNKSVQLLHVIVEVRFTSSLFHSVMNLCWNMTAWIWNH